MEKVNEYPYIKENKDFKVVVLDHNNLYIYYSTELELDPETAFKILLTQEEFKDDKNIQNLKDIQAKTDFGIFCGIAYVHRDEIAFY